jgi:hypothetical protein
VLVSGIKSVIDVLPGSGMSGLSYSQRLQRIGMETLELRRLKIDLIMMFKILNNFVETDFSIISSV